MISLQIQRREIHRFIYLLGLALMVCTIPLSRFLLSISQFILVFNWIAEGNFRRKLQMCRQNPHIIVFASVFLVYVVSSIYSENTSGAVRSIKNTLPLLALPVIMGTSSSLSPRTVKNLLLLFCGSVCVASLICLLNYIINGIPPSGNFRDISIFMLHIRFAFLIDMAIISLCYFTLYPRYGSLKNWTVFAAWPVIVFLIAFLFFLRSLSGIAILGILAILLLTNNALHLKRVSAKAILLISESIIMLAVFGYLFIIWNQNFRAKPVNPSMLDSLTLSNHPYSHDTSRKMLENGHYLHLYVCEPELEKEWNTVGSIPYTGKDESGELLSETLKRYLTSLGFRKDSVGVHLLNAGDIRKIENGIPNYTFSKNPNIRQRIYESMWEIQVLSQSGYVRQHTLGQRFVFLKVAYSAFRKAPWIGTGAGDVFGTMWREAKHMGIEIDPNWEGKPHNQYVFMILAFGISGFLWILFSWIYPVFRVKANRNLLFNLFACTMALSMFLLDTLESYDSIVFFAFFYCLFVFAGHSDEIIAHSQKKSR